MLNRLLLAVAVLLLPVTMGVAFLLVKDLPTVVRGSQGTGIQGVFTAEARDCSGRKCTWVGTFRGEDGSVRTGVHLATGPERPGDRYPAVDSGSENVVYPAEGSWDWLAVVLLLALCLVYSGFVFWAVGFGLYRWHRKRRSVLRGNRRPAG